MRGVYCALDYHELQLWYLDESCSQTEWVLEHVVTPETSREDDHNQQTGKQWIIQDVNYRKFPDLNSGNQPEAPVEEKYDWNSDEDNILDAEDLEDEDDDYIRRYRFLGFHPYKEIVFLCLTVKRGVAYHWNSSKFQDLGSLYPREYHSFAMACVGIDIYFPYTPCWMHDFPGNELESLLKDDQLLGRNLESQVEDDPNFTCTNEYELRKLRGRTKRVKDSMAKVRRRRCSAAR